MLEDLPPLLFARARCLCGALPAFDIGVISVHLQCHNACRFRKLSHLTRDYREIKTVRVAVGKTKIPRRAVAIQSTPPISTPPRGIKQLLQKQTFADKLPFTILSCSRPHKMANSPSTGGLTP